MLYKLNMTPHISLSHSYVPDLKNDHIQTPFPLTQPPCADTLESNIKRDIT